MMMKMMKRLFAQFQAKTKPNMIMAMTTKLPAEYLHHCHLINVPITFLSLDLSYAAEAVVILVIDTSPGSIAGSFLISMATTLALTQDSTSPGSPLSPTILRTLPPSYFVHHISYLFINQSLSFLELCNLPSSRLDYSSSSFSFWSSLATCMPLPLLLLQYSNCKWFYVSYRQFTKIVGFRECKDV